LSHATHTLRGSSERHTFRGLALPIYEEIGDLAGQRLIAAVARGNLGRVAARAGRYDEAGELLSEAAKVLDEMGATAFMLELQARRAELLALRADAPLEAIRLADETLAHAGSGAMPPAVLALLERVRGTGFAQGEDTERARSALRRALEIAEENSVEYEAGLAWRALAALDSLRGNAADAAFAAESAAKIFDRLGVDESAMP
jgi:tetratricopeptide (TPR) repeat protein